MDAKELADRIAEYVQQTDWVTHGELMNNLGDDHRGTFSLHHDGMNVDFCAGISETFSNALVLLQHEQPPRVVLAPACYLTHLIDGCPIPKMPFAKNRPPKNGYKKTRYVFVCFRPASATKDRPFNHN